MSYNDPTKSKKPSVNTVNSLPEEEQDLQHDLVPISLDLPAGIEIQPNTALAGNSYPSPNGNSDTVIEPLLSNEFSIDLHMSDEDDSSSSYSSSSSDSDEKFFPF